MVLDMLANPVVAGGLTLVGRNVFGWVKNSLDDGQIQSYEWAKLLKTLVELGALSVAVYLGLDIVLPAVSPENAAGVVALVDMAKSYLNK